MPEPASDLAVARRTEEETMANVICVLYDDPVGGYPTSYARDALPQLER
jgi:formate dehydrogenase